MRKATDGRVELRTPIRFQGQYHGHEMGLHYNRYRYYDPEVGRFVSKDPIGYTGWAHRAGSNIGQAVQLAENGRRFGSTQAAWSTAGKVLGRALILPTIFEGAYDIATIARCACTAK